MGSQISWVTAFLESICLANLPPIAQLAPLLQELPNWEIDNGAKLGPNPDYINRSGVKPISTAAKVYSPNIKFLRRKLAI
ncbi:MAG: hypothetical protein ACBR12_01070 [Microcoleus sp.]